VQVTRHGIAIHRPEADGEAGRWRTPPLAEWSLIVNFPAPTSSVILELHPRHDLVFAWWTAGALSGPVRLPPGERVRLDFPAPVDQVRLRGEGFLLAVRIPAGPAGLERRAVVLPHVPLVQTPRPTPPLWATIANLQQPQPPTDQPPDVPPPRHALGFEVRWRPAPREGVTVWPVAEAAPPLDATIFQLDHREVFFAAGAPVEDLGALTAARFLATTRPAPGPLITPQLLAAVRGLALPEERREGIVRHLAAGDTDAAMELLVENVGAWEPVLSDENWIVGDRDATTHEDAMLPGGDVMQVFPEVRRPANAGLDLFWRDVFDLEDVDGVPRRSVPAPGTYHQYRIRAVDPIGRPSETWTETPILRLEKHVPPPLPAAPDETPADQLALPAPTGVWARVLVRDAPDLTDEDRAWLGDDENAIVLRWGWHDQQRLQDPFAREFRVYWSRTPLDTVTGTLDDVLNLGNGQYRVSITLERPVAADLAKDLTLFAGHPFHLGSHTAGSTITAFLDTRLTAVSGAYPEPRRGPIRFPLRPTVDLIRPPAWSERVKTQPITEQTAYAAVLRNRLQLSAQHPRDTVWVGVSAADDQYYVPDALVPRDSRPGNESAIVPVVCTGLYYGRPHFDVEPPLSPVPVLIAPEPAARPIVFPLDLTDYLAGTGLGAGDLVQPERVSADAVFAAYYAAADGRIMARGEPGESDEEISVPPADRAAIAAALGSADTAALDDRYVVYLAGKHPRRDRLFQAATPRPVPLGPLEETLPPKPGRWVYRVRKADAAGHISTGGAMAAMIVRVPTLERGGAPNRAPAAPDDPPGLVRLRLPPEPEVTHAFLFVQPASTTPGPVGEADILRVPNRPDLYPQGIFLLPPTGDPTSPSLVKALADPDVTVGEDGFRRVALGPLDAPPGARLHVWACSVTRDGVPSLLAGPWSVIMPLAPLSAPTLAAVRVAEDLVFTWTWPDAESHDVALEWSADGAAWERVSPVLWAEAPRYRLRGAAAGQYRLLVVSLDGRSAFSDAVTA
jgi:hypothetical protein